ncbi:hypothetical protein [Sorangium sp. So ce204]|uniref:hypothetical protein n=1 Tax=Sorangium sp. So ce204 TaxID=3133288 RepID=UPI003F609471
MQQPTQQAPATRVFDGPDAARQLAELGLSADVLRDVILQGEYARVEATENDPLTAEGYDAYRYRVRGFRDAYCSKGWTIDRQRSLEMTRSPCGRRVVITRGGKNGVGLKGTFPQPRRSVGERTKDAVDGHNLLLDPNWFNSTTRKPADSEEIWMLLVERTGDSVRAELSLPLAIDKDGQVAGWLVRILLPAIDMLDPDAARATTPDVVEVIDPPLVRRR